MAQIRLPSGNIIDFGEASEEQINSTLSQMKQERPDLFEERKVETVTEQPDLGTASLEELRQYVTTEKEEGPRAAPEAVASNEGEVQSHAFQFMYGRADDDEERALRLENTFGPGTYEQVGPNDFFLLLDKISEPLKKEYNLPQEGTIRVNEKGFSLQDVSRFGGEEAAPLTAALGAGLMFSGIGLGPGMLLMAAAGAGGRALDELVLEKAEGMQLQSDSEIYGDIAVTGALYGVGEGVGRGLWALGRRLFKGPGPRPDSARIEELVLKGMSRNAATVAAREEAKTTLRRAVNDKVAGARPTISEASGKAIAGRLQAIYEGIFPNRKAAEANRGFVEKVLKDYYGGSISEASAKASLQRQAEQIGRVINNQMKNADADEAIRLANKRLTEVIDNEFDILLRMYKPGQLDINFEAGVNQAARMFEQDSAHYFSKVDDAFDALIVPNTVAPTVVKKWSYQGREVKQGVPWRDDNGVFHGANWVDDLSSSAKAELGLVSGEILKKPGGISIGTFSAKPLQDVIANLQKPQGRAEAVIMGEAFDSGLFKYIKEADSFSLAELTSLRSALRMQGKDPSLMPGLSDAHIGDMVNAIGKTIDDRLEGLAYLRTPQGTALGGMNPRGPIYDEALAKDFSDAILLYKKANKSYHSGIERFKNGATEALNMNIKGKFFVGSKPILETMVEPGNPAKLNQYLKLVTPTGRAMEGLTEAKAPLFNQVARLVDGGQIKQANKLLESARIGDDLIPRLPAFLEQLPVEDAYRKHVQGEFISLMYNYANMAGKRANPLQVRTAFRDSIAREWLDQNSRASSRFGGFNAAGFAQKFDELGIGLQNTMFGKENAASMRSLFKDYHMVGMGKTRFSDATASVLSGGAAEIRDRAAMASVGGRTIAEEIGSLQNILKESIRQSDDELFKAVRTGRLQNADDLVESVIKNPNNYDRLVQRFGKGTMEDPLGMKDVIMGRIVASAFPEGITPDAVASGAWGNGMRKAIRSLNGKTDSHGTGALSKILGQSTVDDLINLSRLGERISDSALKSKTGLAPAAFAAGAGFRLVTAPISFLGEAAAIFTMGRVMRQKWFLNSLLKPRYAAGVMKGTGGRRLYQKAVRAGADLDYQNPLAMEIQERVAQEARLITAAQIGVPDELRETVTEEIIEPGRELMGQAVQNIQPAIQQGLSAINPAPGPQTNLSASEVYRNVELAKLAGVPPVA